MEFIRIQNVIVVFIINVCHKIKCAKRNVRAIKNSAVIQANVVRRIMFPCHAAVIFPAVRLSHVNFHLESLIEYLFSSLSRSSKFGLFDLLYPHDRSLRYFGFIITRTFVIVVVVVVVVVLSFFLFLFYVPIVAVVYV